MKKVFGFLAVAGLLMIAAPAQQANAMSLANPAATKSASESLGVVTQAHWHHHHHWHHRHWHHRWHRHHHRHW